jgi:hypothetical protein
MVPMTQPLRRQPLVEQTAAHLREGFVSGRWTGHLPGVLQLAEELVVSKHAFWKRKAASNTAARESGGES